MRLHFSRVEVGNGDYLTLVDGAGNRLQPFPPLYSKKDFWTDWFAVSSVTIRLQTDYSDCRYGFAIDGVETAP